MQKEITEIEAADHDLVIELDHDPIRHIIVDIMDEDHRTNPINVSIKFANFLFFRPFYPKHALISHV